MNLQGVLEGLLFAAGDEGLNLKQICEIMEISDEKVKEILMNLKKDYENDSRGVRISFLGDAFKLTTKKEHKEYFQKLIQNPETNLLSNTALEILAIIAYNQPITRVEIDNMRGVASAHMVRKLVAKGLIKEVGKSTMPGRPNLYRTTSEFLDFFGLATLNDLPELNEKYNNEKKIELFESIYKEEATNL